MIHSSDKEKEINVQNSDLVNARRTAENSVQIGRSALIELEQQNESLEKTEDTLESNQFILNKSLRLLRFVIFYTI